MGEEKEGGRGGQRGAGRKKRKTEGRPGGVENERKKRVGVDSQGGGLDLS